MARSPFDVPRSRLRLLGLLFVLVIVFAVFTVRWIIDPGTTDQRLIAPADAIAVFDGGDGERLERALEVRASGRADVVVIPNGTRPGWPEANELCLTDVLVECPRPDSESTRDAAQAIADLATDNGWDSLILVSSTDHVTRASLRLDRCFQGTITTVEADPDLNVLGWLRTIPTEWFGLAADHIWDRGC